MFTILGYLEGWKSDIKHTIGYALKANFNPTILRIFRDHGLSCIAVSGNEVKLALREGFPPSSIILNGNGKQTYSIFLLIPFIDLTIS
jgi:diaminopimelate decarboxylase